MNVCNIVTDLLCLRFPRIAVNVEKHIRNQLEERAACARQYHGMASGGQGYGGAGGQVQVGSHRFDWWFKLYCVAV